jgi:Rho-binding antiterminator
MNEKDYRRVACSFYDQLEEAATLRHVLKLIYTNPQGDQQEVETRLVDFKTTAEGEFAILENGDMLRLDQIVKIDRVGQ